MGVLYPISKFRENEGLGKIVVGIVEKCKGSNVSTKYNLFKNVSINV